MADTARTQLVTPVVTRRHKAFSDTVSPYLFILPMLLVFLVLRLGPSIYALVLSLFRYRGYGAATWVGVGNYVTLLQYDVFWIGLKNSFFYWGAHVIPMMGIAFLLALLANSKLAKATRIVKPIIFIPQIVAAVSAALIFRNLFGTKYGVVNTMLGAEIPWLEDMTLARWVVVVVLIWRQTGYWFVIYLAGLTSIPPSVLEAATVDGANAWQKLTHITVPLMRNTFLFSFVVDGISTLKLYGLPNVLGAGQAPAAPLGMAPVLNVLISGITNGRYGRACAVGWLLFIVILVLTRIQFFLLGGRAKKA